MEQPDAPRSNIPVELAAAAAVHPRCIRNRNRILCRGYDYRPAAPSGIQRYFAFNQNPISRKSSINVIFKAFRRTQITVDLSCPEKKAIHYSMTSFMTTGGIRDGKVPLEKFMPRTFNMGFTREVYDKVGGFREMFSDSVCHLLR